MKTYHDLYRQADGGGHAEVTRLPNNAPPRKSYEILNLNDFNLVHLVFKNRPMHFRKKFS